MPPRVETLPGAADPLPSDLILRETLAPRSASRQLSWAEVSRHNTRADAWIVIRNRAYDVTAFAAEHPGGDILFTAAGGDATDVFAAFHAGTDSWKMLPDLCVGAIDITQGPSEVEKIGSGYVDDVVTMRKDIQKLGLLRSSKAYYAFKLSSNFAILSASVAILTFFPGQWGPLLLSAFLLGLFWQQCGWLAHDFLHHQVFANRTVNNMFGILVGNIWQGFSVAWWKNKHNHHHAVPNVTDSPSGGDPDIQTMPVLWWSEKLIEGDDIESLPKFLLQNQALFYFPILCMARTSWVIQSILHQLLPRNPFVTSDTMYALELAGLAMHHVLYLYLLSFIPSFLQLVVFVILTQGLGGLLIGVVFTVGHNAMEVFTHEELRKTHFVSLQVRTTRNVTPTLFNNWFTGGLGYQVEHHIWPTLPRHSLPQAAVILRKFCHDHKIPYTSQGLIEGNADVWRLLSAIGDNA